MKAATRWLYDPANRDAAIDILAKDTKIDLPIAEKIYDYMVGSLKPWPDDARIAPQSMQKIIELMVQIGDLKPGPRPDCIYLQSVDLRAVDFACYVAPRNNGSSKAWRSHIVELFTQRFLTLMCFARLSTLFSKCTCSATTLMTTATFATKCWCTSCWCI